MAALSTYYLPQYATTTLNVPGGLDNSQTTGIILTAVPSDIDISKPGILCLTYANPLNTSNAEFVTYTSIDGSNELQGVSRAGEGLSAKTHDNGATVAWIVSKSHINALMDAVSGVTTGISLNTADMNGTKLIIDADADTSITADTDDQVDLEVGGSDRFRFKTADMDIVTATGNIQVAGADPKRAFYIPAQGMIAATTNGAASGQYESTTNKNNMKYLAFDSTTDEYACFSIPSPANWDAGTVTAKFYWTTESGGAAETVTWAIQGVATANDDTLDVAYGTAQTVADTWIADDDLHITSATSAMTIAGSPAAGEWVDFRIYRDVSADDLGGDAWLLGVRIEFGVAQYNDA